MDKRNLELAVELRHDLHSHAELSGQEVWTKQRLMGFLREHTSLELEDRGSWFFARYSSGKTGPAIAFRADCDAVAMEEGLDIPHASKNPGVAHKCGHDGHSATLAGLALEIDKNGAGRDVYFLFQPAEETGQGAAQCVPMLKEHPDISEIYALHNMPVYPLGAVALRNGTICCASVGVELDFTGGPAHASQPETGRNPSPAIASVVQALEDIADPSRYKGLVLCTVVYIHVGEKAFGIAAGKGSLWVTCRGQYENEMQDVVSRLEQTAREQAAKHGLTLEIKHHDAFPDTANNPACTDRVRSVCRDMGIDVIEMEKPFRSSEDFGNLLHHCPGAMFLLGAGNGPDLHTFEYDYRDDIIEQGVEIFKRLIQGSVD